MTTTRGSWGWAFLIGAATTAVHLVLTLLGLLAGLFGGAGSLSPLGRVLGSLFGPLSFPIVSTLAGSSVLDRWGDEQLVLLGLMAANSMVWGTAVGLLWRWWRVSRSK